MNKPFDLRTVEISCASLLVLLWTYSLSIKLQAFAQFKAQMSDQVFPIAVVPFLVYTVLLAQLLGIVLLLFARTRLLGFWCSLILMLAFTGYFGLVLLNAFKRVPCHCISLLPGMGFQGHLYFNLFFTAVAVMGLIFTLKKERRNKGMDTLVSHAPLPG
uniref:MauE/DoxX family redox-associated membrane protein n=1 Tax=Pedobacter schmidteae TaxID=2201271 RepID=UPI000EAC4A4A|nr:MauE/DoxX family redox-associated membrane protein [Pedobacter schmidteae]